MHGLLVLLPFFSRRLGSNFHRLDGGYIVEVSIVFVPLFLPCFVPPAGDKKYRSGGRSEPDDASKEGNIGITLVGAVLFVVHKVIIDIDIDILALVVYLHHQIEWDAPTGFLRILVQHERSHKDGKGGCENRHRRQDNESDFGLTGTPEKLLHQDGDHPKDKGAHEHPSEQKGDHRQYLGDDQPRISVWETNETPTAATLNGIPCHAGDV